METNSFNLSRSTAFFSGVTPYFFCSLQVTRCKIYKQETAEAYSGQPDNFNPLRDLTSSPNILLISTGYPLLLLDQKINSTLDFLIAHS